MGLQLVLLVILQIVTSPLLWLTAASAQDEYSFPPIPLNTSDHLAKDDCTSRCGNVAIPYPFGMDRDDCYLDERYSIECRNTTDDSTRRPYLRNNGLEVLGFSSLFSGQRLLVNNPIIALNCPLNGTLASNSNTSINLTGSPFDFSRSSNIFMSVGGNYHAKMVGASSTTIAECDSICDSSTSDNRCCGTNCCQAAIGPTRLQVFNASFSRRTGDDSAGCTHAFLVDEVWIGIHDPIVIQNMTHVPAVLIWRLDNVTPTQFQGPGAYCYNETSGEVIFYCVGLYEANPYLPNGCQDVCLKNPMAFDCPMRKVNNSKQKMITIGVCAGSTGAILLLLAAWWLYKVIIKRNDMKRKKKFFKQNGGVLLQQHLSSSDGSVDKIKVFDSKELEKATDHYNENHILGQGGQGTVHKGMLPDGRIVAVKKSKIVDDHHKVANIVDEGKIQQFINEIVILSQINHRNIVRLSGCCLETEVPLLVYEYISNGTLFQHIHDPSEDSFPLSWDTRYRIAMEVAGALSYLHYDASIPIYHRDIKSTNILLDDKHKAKVADFGTSRSIAIDQTHLTTLVHGTFGYLDPEYFQSSQFTDKSDVYSFGVVLVELLTSQKPISSTRSQQSRSLATNFIQAMEENYLLEILDPQILKEDEHTQEMIAVAHLAKRCLNLKGKKRPTMKQVAMELERIKIGSQGDSTMTQINYDEVEFNTSDLYEESDALSSSTGMFSIYHTASSFDVQPLLRNKS